MHTDARSTRLTINFLFLLAPVMLNVMRLIFVVAARCHASGVSKVLAEMTLAGEATL